MVETRRWINALGVRVVIGDAGPLNGAYMHDLNAVVVDCKLGPVQHRSTLMHELGHAFYGHDRTTAKGEHEASEWAARQMIRGCQWVRATQAHDSPLGVAQELGVLPRDVENYAAWVDRVMPSLRECLSSEKTC